MIIIQPRPVKSYIPEIMTRMMSNPKRLAAIYILCRYTLEHISDIAIWLSVLVSRCVN